MLSKVRVVRVESSPVKSAERLPWPRKADDGVTSLGIDVVEKQKDIIKIVHKYFRVVDVQMDELLQEVFLAIIHKNYGRSAHNPSKSSFGHYVYMVANNVCINLVHRKKRFANERESLDAPNGPDDSRTLMDTLEVAEEVPEEGSSDRMDDLEQEMRRNGMWDVARYVRAVRTGANPDVIREALTFGDRTVTTKVVREWRMQVKQFAESYC